MLTPEKVIVLVHRCVALSFCWPLPSTATKFQLLRLRLLQFIMGVNGSLLFLPLCYTVYLQRDSVVEAIKAAYFILATIQIPIQTIYFVAQYDRLQLLVEVMKDCVETAKTYERSVFQRYINKYSLFYGVCSAWFYQTAAIMVVGTLFIEQRFPVNVEYPFATNWEPLRTVIYLHQAFVTAQCAAHVSVNAFGALLLLFAAARFEITSIELQHVNSIDELTRCIQKYYETRRFAYEVVNIFQYVTLTSIILSSLSLLFFGFFLIGKYPLIMKAQFVFLTITALLEVYMCAWPADDLMETSEHVMEGVYQSAWYVKCIKMQKNVLCTLIPQKPITISFKCIIPLLSLSYFSSYTTNTFSIFMALRAILNDESDN